MYSDSISLAVCEQEEPIAPPPRPRRGIWQSSNPMPADLYDEAIERERQEQQIVADDFGPITRGYAIAQLKKSEEWLAKQMGHKSRTQDDLLTVQNIVLGCFGLLGFCIVNTGRWLSRRDRGRLLKEVKSKFKTKVGHRAVRDLIRFTLSSLEAAIWLDDEPITTVHLPRWTKPKVVSAATVEKMLATKRARAAEETENRNRLIQARERAFSSDAVSE